MDRQLEVNANMRRILVDWLVELYDELELPVEALLQAVHASDRFLSSHLVPKETLQLVGAVSLMLSCNHFCKLPHQDGEEHAAEHRLNHAEDIVYCTSPTGSQHSTNAQHGIGRDLPFYSPYRKPLRDLAYPSRDVLLPAYPARLPTFCAGTDNTYTIGEVLSMEAQLLHGHVELAHTSPLEYLSRCCHGSGLPDEVVSLGCELIVRSAREYRMLQLHARLLAACTLYLAVRNARCTRRLRPRPPHAALDGGPRRACGLPDVRDR